MNGFVSERKSKNNNPSPKEENDHLKDVSKITQELKSSRQAIDDLERSLENERLKRELVENKLQKMEHRVIEVQEEERKRISRNLHDGLGQNLYSHLITINLLQSQLIHPLIEQIEGEAMQLIEQVREISWELRPSVLDDLGLVPAIRSYLARYTEYYKIKVHLDCQLHRRLHINVDLTIYRIIQEALTNIRKYADTKEAWITIKDFEKYIELMVEDHGKGFNTTQVSLGVGISSMQERARAVGGEFHLDSDLGKGTKLSLIIPI